MFSRVLVANRGEIAVRVIRALHELGIEAVAVYSTVDRDSLHVRLADRAVCIGPPAASESYLRIPAVIAAAETTGCEAVHPGYGFLSENTDFVRACAENELVFVGPPAEVMERMADKTRAKAELRVAGVPLVPGTAGAASLGEVRTAADELGFPVLLKAVSGGGGKGMRLVDSADQLATAFSTARAEAEAAFGDGSLYLEKAISPARHVEVQVLCDRDGGVVTLGERECSIQRRHQKLIEESPSPALDEATRAEMETSVERACRLIGYENAGTFEFLLDDKGNFFFLEVNTRVQVEHPVTEEVTGIDIVQTGIRIAAGEPMPFSQKDVSWRGHAIEVRINAEDPGAGFVPSPGAVVVYEEPGGPGVRVDSSLKGPGLVPEAYDPLFAKLIARGPDRKAALARLRRALAEFRIEGIATTLPFFRAILDDEAFVSGDYTTGFVADRMDGLAIEAAQTAGLDAADEKASREVEVEVEVDGRLFRVRVFGDVAAGRGAPPRRSGRTTRRTAVAEGAIAAPMQGTIVKVLVEEGQEVAADDAVCLLEAMKMESEVRAQRAGRVLKVLVEAGKTVRPGEPLVVLE